MLLMEMDVSLSRCHCPASHWPKWFLFVRADSARGRRLADADICSRAGDESGFTYESNVMFNRFGVADPPVSDPWVNHGLGRA